MDREILYRGKRLDNGEWVEGDRVEQNNPEYHDYIITEFAADVDNRHIDILTCDIYEVDTSTVGRYTGLTDRNGKRIFEGDLIEHAEGPGVPPLVVTWNYLAWMLWDQTDNTIDTLGDIEPRTLGIIGNIHDNPELFKEDPNNGTAD